MNKWTLVKTGLKKTNEASRFLGIDTFFYGVNNTTRKLMMSGNDSILLDVIGG